MAKSLSHLIGDHNGQPPLTDIMGKPYTRQTRRLALGGTKYAVIANHDKTEAGQAIIAKLRAEVNKEAKG